MFHPLQNISDSEIPQRFTYPFHYEAHPLCQLASTRLQEKLRDWDLEQGGKMFGVLIVRNQQGNLGYLWAYSGNITKDINAQLFVPPIYDSLDKNSFFLAGEKEISLINCQIKKLETSDRMSEAIQNQQNTAQQMKSEILAQKFKNQESKKNRQQLREEQKEQLSTEDFNILNVKLIKESQREKSALKQLKTHWNNSLSITEKELEELRHTITLLKDKRQTKSALLQQRLFDQYQLLNANGKSKGLCSIFQEQLQQQPPAAAGDCAAPRLLQYAFQNGMQAIAMAEFWWGKSPKTIIRKQGHYYPSCRSKCDPILHHMLQGLEVDANPISGSNEPIKIIFEDDDLLVIDKPSGLLSVKGKSSQPYVLDSLKTLRPEVTTPFVVHRLDMATSGLIIIAKNSTTYKAIQEQFASRQVKKKYIAILDGEIKDSEGKINLPLRGDLDNRPQQMVCHEHGKSALTIWKKIEYIDGKTRIAFFPITGRTHQLRVHAAHPNGLNCAIIGDELYGTKKERLLLHASQVEFTHPQTGKLLKFNSAIPF